MGLLNKMTAAFAQKATQVAEGRVSLLAWSMANYVGGKLKSIIQKDPNNGELFLAIEQEVAWFFVLFFGLGLCSTGPQG